MKDSIKKLVIEIVGEMEMTYEDNLYDKGISSVNMMAILGQIEDEFDIEIPEEFLELSSFQTINNIHELIIKTQNMD